MENLLLCGRLKSVSCHHLSRQMYCAANEKGSDKEAAWRRRIYMILLYLCVVTSRAYRRHRSADRYIGDRAIDKVRPSNRRRYCASGEDQRYRKMWNTTVPEIIGSDDVKEKWRENMYGKNKKTKSDGRERWRRFERVWEKTRDTRVEVRRARNAEWEHEAGRTVARSWLQVNLIPDGSSSPLKYPVNRFQSSTRPRSLADIRFSLLRPERFSSLLSAIGDSLPYPSSSAVRTFYHRFSLSHVYPHRVRDKTKGH